MQVREKTVDLLTNGQLLERYRFDRNGLKFLEQLLGPRIQPATHRHNSLSAMEKILLTLRFLATGGIQLNDADIHNVSQSTVSKVINEVTQHLSSHQFVARFIKFPTTIQELDVQVEHFHGIARFPRVVGLIDGTHVRIKAPSEDEAVYVNRKGFHSINVQFVIDAFDKITNIVARWPGSVHDSRILNNSGLRQMFADGHIPFRGRYHILGDSGYACSEWLLTPYLNPQPGSQSAYNRYPFINNI